MEFLRFIFSGFWVWLGFMCLAVAIFGGVQETVKVCKRNRKVRCYRIGARWNVEIENASAEDAQQAIISTVYGQDGEETLGKVEE